MIQKVTIDAQPCCTKIFADGKEIEGVRFFECKQEVGQELPVLSLEIVAREIEVVGQIETSSQKKMKEMFDEQGNPTGSFVEVLE